MTSHIAIEFLENLPPPIRNCGKPIFVCWGFQNPRNEFERHYGEKAPIDAKTGRPASSTNPDTWAPLGDCIQAVSGGKYLGVGIVLSTLPDYSLGLVGIDIDHCIDDQGEPTLEARRVIEALKTYTELSPSRTGLRLFVRGAIPRAVKVSGIELYVDERYLRITGYVYGGYKPIADGGHAVQQLYADLTTRQGRWAGAPVDIAGPSYRYCEPLSPQAMEWLFQQLIAPHPRLDGQFHRPRGNASDDDFAFAKELLRQYPRFDPADQHQVRAIMALLFHFREYHDKQTPPLDQSRLQKKDRFNYLSATIGGAFADLQIVKRANSR